MTRYETPTSLASALVRWAPRRIDCLLDPAVGTGALIRPLLGRLCGNGSHIYCVDIDQGALGIVRNMFGSRHDECMTLINQDFLGVDFDAYAVRKTPFDCVIMNPPFAGRRQHFREVAIPHPDDDKSSLVKYAPLEGAFLIRAVELVKPGGRVLAIVPSSIVASDSARWIREFLFASGSILCVHELPSFTFEKVEARIYLLVFEKARSTDSIILRNHKLVRPDELLMTRESIGKDSRLDYGFHASKLWFEVLKLATPKAGWSPLRRYADLMRGRAASPKNVDTAVHTTDYKEGFWWLPRANITTRQGKLEAVIGSHDLLLTRVGRRSTDSIGIPIGAPGSDYTDCIIRIRPKNGRWRTRLLFALRTLLVCEEGRSLVQRGSSAKYVTHSDLESLSIPWNIANMCPRTYQKYRTAARNRQFSYMCHLESYVQGILRRRVRNQGAVSH